MSEFEKKLLTLKEQSPPKKGFPILPRVVLIGLISGTIGTYQLFQNLHKLSAEPLTQEQMCRVGVNIEGVRFIDKGGRPGIYDGPSVDQPTSIATGFVAQAITENGEMIGSTSMGPDGRGRIRNIVRACNSLGQNGNPALTFFIKTDESSELQQVVAENGFAADVVVGREEPAPLLPQPTPQRTPPPVSTPPPTPIPPIVFPPIEEPIDTNSRVTIEGPIGIQDPVSIQGSIVVTEPINTNSRVALDGPVDTNSNVTVNSPISTEVKLLTPIEAKMVNFNAEDLILPAVIVGIGAFLGGVLGRDSIHITETPHPVPQGGRRGFRERVMERFRRVRNIRDIIPRRRSTPATPPPQPTTEPPLTDRVVTPPPTTPTVRVVRHGKEVINIRPIPTDDERNANFIS